MDNLAKKQSVKYSSDSVVHRSVKQEKKRWFTPGEKIIFLAFALLICFMGAKVVSTQAALYEINKDIQDVELKVKEQQKVNRDLEVQVSEESTYEKIWKRAKELGLDLSEQNIKVVQPK